VFTGVASEARVLPCDVIAAARRRSIPTLLRDVITAARRRPASPHRRQRVFGRELFSGRLPRNAPLRNPCRATQQLVDMSQYYYTKVLTLQIEKHVYLKRIALDLRTTSQLTLIRWTWSRDIPLLQRSRNSGKLE
jgi:hypothetical protein